MAHLAMREPLEKDADLGTAEKPLTPPRASRAVKGSGAYLGIESNLARQQELLWRELAAREVSSPGRFSKMSGLTQSSTGRENMTHKRPLPNAAVPDADRK